MFHHPPLRSGCREICGVTIHSPGCGGAKLLVSSTIAKVNQGVRSVGKPTSDYKRSYGSMILSISRRTKELFE